MMIKVSPATGTGGADDAATAAAEDQTLSNLVRVVSVASGQTTPWYVAIDNRRSVIVYRPVLMEWNVWVVLRGVM